MFGYILFIFRHNFYLVFKLKKITTIRIFKRILKIIGKFFFFLKPPNILGTSMQECPRRVQEGLEYPYFLD